MCGEKVSHLIFPNAALSSQIHVGVVHVEMKEYRHISSSVVKYAGGILEIHISFVYYVPLCYMVGLWVYAGLVQRIERCGYSDTSLSFAFLSCWFFWHFGK